ncbi:MAG: outer membrane beta-barrel protein [Acidobacteriota bacterium]|nr:outer membrane beta-barrel protein [Acidobacteriota bacterium]
MTRTIALATLTLCLIPAALRAQTGSRVSGGLEAGAGLTSQDENFAGSGLLTGARLGFDLTDRTALELSVTRIAHHRDFEGSPVSVDGRSIFTGLSLKHDFTRGRLRPFVVAGYGQNHHAHTWTDPSGVRDRSATSHGYNAGGGLALRRGRWEHGVEARFYMLAIDEDSSAAFIVTGAYRVGLPF